MRQAERAIFDLRRSLPILIRDGHQYTLIQAIEGLNDSARSRFMAADDSAPVLLLSSHRMRALGYQDIDSPTAIEFKTLPAVPQLHELAAARNASLPADARPGPADRMQRAAIRMLTHSLLLPAALASRLDGAAAERIRAEIDSGELLVVDAELALTLGRSGPGALTRISEARVPLAEADNARFVLFREADGVHEHVAIVIGEPAEWASDVPVRLHSSCLTGDLFGSLRCDCGEQLRRGVVAIRAQGGGVLLYLSQEGRGIGLANKLRAYTLQDQGLDTIDADQTIGFSKDERNFRVAHEMLEQLGVKQILLLTNNPSKVEALQRAGIRVNARQAIYGDVTPQNQRYLSTKAKRHGHLLEDLLCAQDENSPAEPASLPSPSTEAKH